jgi:hypothetical protein
MPQGFEDDPVSVPLRRRTATAAAVALLSLVGFAPPASAAAPATVAKYAPSVYLAPGEAYLPMSAGTFVAQSSLSWAHDTGCPDATVAERTTIDASKLGAGGYQHQIADVLCVEHGTQYKSNELTRPRQGDKPNVPTAEGFFLNFPNTQRSGQGTAAPVYYEYSAHKYVTYWFFYAFNDAPAPIDSFDHEGDWERISVQLDAQDNAVTVAFYEHSGYCTLPWSQVAQESAHPVAYSAVGTHATYWKAGTFPLVGGLANDVTGKGTSWKTYQTTLSDAHAQGWFGFGGAWGEVGEVEDSTGPLGPSSFKGPAPSNWNVPCTEGVAPNPRNSTAS